ncbi:hypothetical protein RCL_jg5706.t1 [Rhizophagus clarus]|uniref:Uncharacterized protein n=1 Tax=Rhizophagus clarus TaxID=94130 RepID=A0A8H3R0H8_9GLOM|nr:hypothetical protein RCL_jg5706.t1 [Rhizophagus clarus]
MNFICWLVIKDQKIKRLYEFSPFPITFLFSRLFRLDTNFGRWYFDLDTVLDARREIIFENEFFLSLSERGKWTNVFLSPIFQIFGGETSYFEQLES